MKAAIRNLASVMIRPRPTVRRILDAGSHRAVIALVLLAIFSAFISDLEVRGAQEAVRQLEGYMVALIVAGVLVGVTVAALALFYVLSWMTFLVGRVLEGKGEPVEIRTALAWSLAPQVWALLYRVPLAFFMPADNAFVQAEGSRFSITPGRLAAGCGTAAAVALVELAVFVWMIVLASNAVGEAHRFSTLRGFGTLVLCGAIPLVIAVAAGLAVLL